VDPGKTPILSKYKI